MGELSLSGVVVGGHPLNWGGKSTARNALKSLDILYYNIMFSKLIKFKIPN